LNTGTAIAAAEASAEWFDAQIAHARGDDQRAVALGGRARGEGADRAGSAGRGRACDSGDHRGHEQQ